MAIVERSPNHLVLNETHPLSKDLYANVFGEALPSADGHATRLFDVSSICENPVLFRKVIKFLAQRYRDMGDSGPTHVLGVESRGYVIGAALAFELSIPFVLARVTKRFPSSFIRESKSFNFVPDSLSIRNGSITSDSNALIVDDFIASGRAVISTLRLTEIVGCKVVEAVTVCDIPSLNGVGHIHKCDGGQFSKTPILTLMHFNATQEEVKEQLSLYKTRFMASRL